MPSPSELGRMLDYIPRLDGLRALAVGLVLLTHFAPIAIVQRLAPGTIGVRLFFVLSGYLITRIILDYRRLQPTIQRAAAQFYWRRFLRLAPPLVFAICAAAYFGVANMQNDWWIHALYLTNFRIALTGEWGPAGHLWSLSVEEQFYLIWFFLLICIPQRWLLPAIIIAIIVAPLYRIFGVSIGMGPRSINQMLPGNIDFLAVGGLIAYAEIRDFALYRRLVILFRNPFALFISLGGAFGLLAVRHGTPTFTLLAFPLALSVAAASFMLMAREPDNRLTACLEWPIVRHLGKISYGIFVYHLFVPAVIGTFSPYLYAAFGGPPSIMTFTVNTAGTLLIAELSWWLLERPLSKFKGAIPLDRPALADEMTARHAATR
jgi:peptidoglycan/LPS O-acetylase OafA/YrhL